MRKNQKLPYSYHSFIYPFKYHDKNGEMNQQIISSILEASGFELETSFLSGEEQYTNQFEEQYNIYQYLFPNARPNVLNLENNSNVNQQFIYRLDNSEKTTKNQYHIVMRNPNNKKQGQAALSNKSEKQRTISLKVRQIKLVLFYKMKIGVLSIETEFYGCNNVVYMNGREIREPFEKVRIINDYGRRVFSPVYDVNNNFMPEKLILELHQKGIAKAKRIVTDFSNEKELLSIGNNGTAPKMINELINGYRKDKLEIESILDDRMFATYLIRDNTLAEYFKTDNALKDEKLYQFAFCDSSFCTCQDSQMLVEKLEEHTYRRWKNYGTLFTATEYALGCITSEDDTEKSVIIPFLTIYTEMVKLVLAQRAAMVNLESEAAKISIKFMTKIGDASEDKKAIIEEIRTIWQKYVIFQNELYMPEITFQEQGVELYAMLKKFLKLQEQNDYLMDELNNLHEVAELVNTEIENENNLIRTENDEKMNKSINLLAVAGTALAIVSMAQDYLADIDFTKEKTVFAVLKNSALYGVGFLVLFQFLNISMNKFSKLAEEKSQKSQNRLYLLFAVVILVIVFLMFILKQIIMGRKI